MHFVVFQSRFREVYSRNNCLGWLKKDSVLSLQHDIGVVSTVLRVPMFLTMTSDTKLEQCYT